MTALEVLKSANKIAFGEMTISPSDMHKIEATVEKATVLMHKEGGPGADFRNAFNAVRERLELKMSCTMGNYIPVFGSDEDLQEIEARYGSQDQ
jgi:hypothetical protein